MIETLSSTIQFGVLHGKSFALGFFIALSLKRGRVQALLDTTLPSVDD